MNNRRTTLGILQPDNYGNYGYNAPTIASSVKANNARTAPIQGQQSRISMAPQRQSMAPQRTSMPSQNPPSAGRTNLVGLVDGMASLQMNSQGLSGASRNSGSGARRSSGFGTGRTSQVFSQYGNKDPRPIREKEWQRNAISSLLRFLIGAGFPHAISAKALQAPTQSDFKNIFKFLYAHLDPKYEYTKKFEEEVPLLMKGLKYPFADQITRSQLTAVGSMHAWPSMLAVLTWLRETIEACEQMDRDNEIEDFGAGFEDNGYPNHAEKIFFEYLSKTYGAFMGGEDNYGQMDAELIGTFDRKNELVMREIQANQLVIDELERELEKLHDGEDPLLMLSREKDSLQQDKEKFRNYHDHLEAKKNKAMEIVQAIRDDVVKKQSEISQLQDERDQMQKVVDSQQVRPEDVDRMNADKETLVKQIEAVQAKSESVAKVVWEHEINLQKRMDQLEKMVQDYNQLAFRLNLLDPSSPNAEGIRYELEFNVHAARPEEAINLDLRGRIKPALAQLHSRFNNLVHQTTDESIALQDKLDSLSEQVTEKIEELKGVEARIKRLGEQYIEEKESASQENVATTEEVERMDAELARIRLEATNGLVQSQQRVQNVTFEYEELRRKASEQTEETAREMFKALEELINFKKYVEDELARVEKMVAEQHLTVETLFAQPDF